MTQEEKSLLLKDLSARLYYKPTVLLSEKEHCILCGIDGDKVYLNVDSDPFNVESIKPYLRPMSSVTKEERKERLSFFQIVELNSGLTPLLSALKSFEYIDWLNAHHFDYHGLIEKGLALEAPEGMYNI